MKKRLFLFVAIVAIVACVFAISASAADSINPSSSNEFGTLTTFDDPIGNTGISNKKDDGTIARTVIFDGTNYYTVPTVYILEESPKNSNGRVGEMFLLNFGEIGTKLGKTFNKNSIIRMEFPSDIDFICQNNECLNNCTNLVEVILNDGLRFWGNDTGKAFTHCENLVSIDLSGVEFEFANNTFALFEYCYKLESVILPDGFLSGTTYVQYDTSHMFSHCYKLETIENAYGFFGHLTTLKYKTFYNCYVLPEAILWDGLQVIEGRAFGNCGAIETVIMPNSITTIGTNETVFESCTSLKTVVMSQNVTSLGAYCFEKCTALEKVWMPAPWIEDSTQKLTMSNQVFGQAKKSGVKFYLMCTEEEMATYIDQSAYISDNSTDAWKHGEFIYGATLADKCTIFLGGHEKPASVNSCTSGGNCVVCATALEGIATDHNLVTTLTYPNGFAKNGVKATVCQNWKRCTAENESVATNPIFASVGYSYREDTNRSGLTSGFTLDRDALDEFVAFNPDADLVVSIFVVNPTYLGESFFEDGLVVVSGNKGVIQVDISELSYENYNYFISGFSLENMQNLELAFGLLVSDGTKTELVQKTYAQNEESAIKKTYTDNKGYTLSTVTVQSVAPQMVEALLPSNEDQE